MSQPKDKRENKIISRGYKQGTGRANLRKKEKTSGLEGDKNRGWGGPTSGKKRKQMD